METVKVKALVVRNNGRKAVLKPLDEEGNLVTMFRGEESRRDFMQMFPQRGMVELDRVQIDGHIWSQVKAKVDVLAEKGGFQDPSVLDQIIKETLN